MARVAVLVPDLLFGSKVVAALEQEGHDVQLLAEAPSSVEGVDVLVVDLTRPDQLDGPAVVQALGDAPVRTLGFFAHVEPEVRERALAAGFDQVVPRSRMAREGAQLVGALARG
jgi:CheY-like chemotaxis protein